jgi:nucleotide-binding universal stress UspA family protein
LFPHPWLWRALGLTLWCIADGAEYRRLLLRLDKDKETGMAIVFSCLSRDYKREHIKHSLMKTLLGFIRDPAYSQSIVHYFVELSKDLDLNLHLLYAENPADHSVGSTGMSGVTMAHIQQGLETQIQEGKKTLKKLVGQMMPQIAGEVVVEITTAIGNEVSVVNEMLASGEIHMVAVENTAADGFWWKDTLVQDMVRNIECPVWVIPENAEYHSFRKIIYATDYHEEDIPTLQKLLVLTRGLTPSILALHIIENADFGERVKTAGFQKMLETKTAYEKISAKALNDTNGEDLVQLINSYAAMNRADLIVVLKENKKFLDRIFSPSDAEKIIKSANSPVLVYHSNQ